MRARMALGGRYIDADGNRHELLEMKYNGRIIWPMWSLQMSTNRMDFSAAGGNSTLVIVAAAYNENGTPIRRITLSAADLQIVKYGDAGGRISRNGLTFSAANLGTTPYDAVEGYFQITYAAKNLSIQLPFSQALNRIEETIPAHTATTGVGALTFSPAVAPVLGGEVSVTCVRTYTLVDAEYIWSSTAHSGGAMHTGRTETVRPQSLTCTPNPAYVGSDYVRIGSNAHNDEERYYSIRATYDGVRSSYYTLTQAADSYTAIEVPVAGSYYAHISIFGSAGLTAKGGGCTLAVDAGHDAKTEYRWASGGSTFSDSYAVTDGYEITKSGDSSYFHVTGLNVTHDNMRDRGTDWIQFTATNTSDRTVTASTSVVTITNAATPKQNAVFTLRTPYVGDIPSSGDPSILFNYASYVEEWTEYESGYETTHVTTHRVADLYTTVGTLSKATTEAATGSVYLNVQQNIDSRPRDVKVTMTRLSDIQEVTLVQEAYVSPASSIIITESPHALSRNINIKNTYSSALSGYVSYTVTSGSTGDVVDSGAWTFNLASGASVDKTLPYGYDYYVDYQTTIN